MTPEDINGEVGNGGEGRGGSEQVAAETSGALCKMGTDGSRWVRGVALGVSTPGILGCLAVGQQASVT